MAKTTTEQRETAPSAPTARSERPSRPLRSAVVTGTRWLTPQLIRVTATGPDLAELPELTFTDHYIKMLFPPAGADYRWPFDEDEIKATRDRDQWPTTRTYTIRSFDRERQELSIDFVVHGDEGLAGPWAARARPGTGFAFRGPGGAYAPDRTADVQLLIGDEAAIPAIAATLDRLPADARALVFAEVEDADGELELRTTECIEIHWVHRDGRPYGEALVAAVRATPSLEGRVQAFAHGNAEMIRELRRHLLGERGLDRADVSISGYWRTGHTEDRWQATKRDFNQQMESDELTTG